jgi:iron complex outermembrane receptor protein
VPPLFPPNTTPFPGVISLRGNDDTLSEVLMAYEIGYRVQPRSFLSFDLALFYNDYDRLVTLQPGPADPSGLPAAVGFPLLFVNDAEGETYGGELAANWSVTDWWMVRGSYSYIQMQIHQGGDDQEGATPHHQIVARSLMDLPFNLQLDITGRYVDSLPALGIDSYVTADVRLGWRPIKNLDISIVGQNLLDNQHAEFGSSVVREQQTEVERAVYGKVTWTF